MKLLWCQFLLILALIAFPRPCFSKYFVGGQISGVGGAGLNSDLVGLGIELSGGIEANQYVAFQIDYNFHIYDSSEVGYKNAQIIDLLSRLQFPIGFFVPYVTIGVGAYTPEIGGTDSLIRMGFGFAIKAQNWLEIFLDVNWFNVGFGDTVFGTFPVIIPPGIRLLF